MQRFLPSEFGMDPALMSAAIEPGRVTFDEKMAVRKAIEEAGIPFTYVSANCFGGYFVGNLCQLESLTPPKHTVRVYGDGNVKGKNTLETLSWIHTVILIDDDLMSAAVFVDEDDIATYTIKTIDDQRTLNKTLYLRPPENVLSQRELIEMWEKMSGAKLEKISIPAEDLLASMKGINIKSLG